MIHYETGILIAIFAFIYSVILTEPNQILCGWWKFWNTLLNGGEYKFKWLFMIIIGCEKCVAGQIALWLYLFTHLVHYFLEPVETFLLHLAFITFTIFCTVIITHTHNLIEKWKNQQ